MNAAANVKTIFFFIIVPLLNLLVLSIVFSYFFRVPTGKYPYAIFLFVALVPWTFLVNAIVSATSSIVANNSLITKIFFPREIIPLTAIASKLVDLLLVSIILVLFLIGYKIPLHLTLLFVPLIFLVQLLLVIGISLILSAINVFYRDVENMLGVIITMWMYLTPIFYPPEIIPEKVRFYFGLNPMVGIIDAYRNTVLFGVPPAWPSFSFSILISIIFLIIGIFIFKGMLKILVEL